jgi:hypothetical protein
MSASETVSVPLYLYVLFFCWGMAFVLSVMYICSYAIIKYIPTCIYIYPFVFISFIIFL